MIQRSLLRQSRVFCARSRYIAVVSPTRSQVLPSRTRSLQGRIAGRYYSSTDTPRDGISSDAAPLEASESELENSDLVRKELESKDKEIIDLKVRLRLSEPEYYLFSQPHTFVL